MFRDSLHMNILHIRIFHVFVSWFYFGEYATILFLTIQHKSTKLNSSKYCFVSLTIQLNIRHLLAVTLP